MSDKKWSEINKRGHGRDKLGKWVTGELYFHRSVIPRLSPETQLIVKKAEEMLPDDAVWNCVKWNPKTGRVVFQYSEDFDTSREPLVTHGYAVDPETGDVSFSKNGRQIWHHKWQWVDDDYEGFDVAKEKARSDWWKENIENNPEMLAKVVGEMNAWQKKHKPNSKEIEVTPQGFRGKIGAYKEMWDDVVSPHIMAENKIRRIVRYVLNEMAMDMQDYTSDATSTKQIDAIHNILMQSLTHDGKRRKTEKKKGVSVEKWVPTKLVIKPQHTIFDLGGGKWEENTELCASNGVRNVIFDPFNRGAEHNLKAFEEARTTGFDVVVCANVLNVIKEPQVRLNTILQAAKVLKPGGVAYFSFYEGKKSGEGGVSVTKKDKRRSSWQNHSKWRNYIPEVQKYFGSIELETDGGIIVARDPKFTDKDIATWWMELDPDSPHTKEWE